MFTTQRQQRWILNLTITVLTLAMLWLIRALFGSYIERFIVAFNAIFLPFAIAIFVSYLLAPLFKLLEKRLYSRNSYVNTIVVFVLVLALLTFLTISIGGFLYTQAIVFVENDWPRILETFSRFLEDNPTLMMLYENFVSYFNLNELPRLSLNLSGLFQTVTSIVITIVLVPVFLFFILTDRDRIYEGMLNLVPLRLQHHVKSLFVRAHSVIESYFNGRFITMAVMALLFILAFFILGFGSRSILFGFMMGFFDIVPYVGPFIAMLLPVLYSLTDETLLFGPWAPLAVIIMVSVGQLIQNNVAQPVIMGKETKLHPLLVLSSFVFFGYLLGVVGIILAIPLTGVIRSSSLYVKELKEEAKLKPTESNHDV